MSVTDYDVMNDEYNDSLSKNKKCTSSGNIIDIILAKLLLRIPCGLSFLCMMSLMVYALIKRLIDNK